MDQIVLVPRKGGGSSFGRVTSVENGIARCVLLQEPVVVYVEVNQVQRPRYKITCK